MRAIAAAAPHARLNRNVVDALNVAADGTYALNGVEYIVPYRVWPKDSVPPKLLGRDMIQSEPLQYRYLHMWVWTQNKAGLFADWNPAVKCPA